jgi:hypothetical protein
MKKIAPILICGLLLLPSFAQATATTHIWGPSTDVQAYRVWHITGDMYLPLEGDDNGGRIPTVTNIGLTVGVLPFKKVNAEIGFDHKSGYGYLDRYPVYLNLKVGVPEGAFGEYSPAAAVGVFDVGTKSYDEDTHIGTNYNVAYLKIAKTFNPAGRISLGFFSGNKDLLLDEKGEASESGVLFAYERTMTEISDKLWLCAEYMGGESAYATFNFGGAWKFAENVALLAAYDTYLNSDLKLPDTFTMQVDIDFNCPFRKK